MILTLAMAGPQKQMCGHWPEHSHHHLNNNYTGPHSYWSNELSARYAGSQAHHINNFTYLYYQRVNGSLLTGTTALPCHVITTISQEQTQFNAYQNYCYEESHCLGHSDLNEMWELWVTVTGHSQVIVTLAWANKPTFSGFLTQNLAFIWFDRLNSMPIGSCTVMATLHTSSIPPWGLHILFFTRKDRYHTLLLLLSLTVHSYPSQQFCFLHQSQQLPQSVSPWMMNLSTLWPHTTLQ